MEILISEDLPYKYQVEMGDFFVNEKKSLGICKIKSVNDTHSRFWLPYEKCSTHAIVSLIECFLFVCYKQI